MKTTTYIVYILLIALPVPHHCNLIQKPIVGIELSDAGFHRDLLYTVQFDYPLAGKECEYVLMQPLPAAVYISVDQLDDLTRLNKLNARYPKFVDIEVPTEKAKPITVLLKGTPKITDSIKLPIHFRYHAPTDKSDFVNVDISTPSMYMKCPDTDNDLIDNELQTTPTIKYCLLGNSNSFIKDTSANKNSSSQTDDCDWKLINVDYQIKSPLSAKIPVGNKKAFPLILYATIIASWIVSLWTVFRTHSIPRRINHKLEEQRILQNKIK